jgi:hypothetical protein
MPTHPLTDDKIIRYDWGNRTKTDPPRLSDEE